MCPQAQHDSVIANQPLHPITILVNTDVNDNNNNNTISNSTALQTTYTVDTVDMVCTVDTAYTVYTIETALHCQNISMYAFVYRKERLERYWSGLMQVGWMGDTA